jgi:hypothetical protein
VSATKLQAMRVPSVITAQSPGYLSADPVFWSLFDHVRISWSQIARLCGVSPACVTRWRQGARAMPPEVKVFLTLLAKRSTEGMERNVGSSDWQRSMAEHFPDMPLLLEANLLALRKLLPVQLERNAALPREVQEEGERLFNEWRSKNVKGSK